MGKLALLFVFHAGNLQINPSKIFTSYTGTSARHTETPDNFVYDFSGRMVVDESKQMDLRYDNFNDRPVQFNQGTPSGNVASYMVYDAGGNRVSKMEYMNGVRQEAKHYFGNGKEIREYPAGPTVEVYPLDSFGRIIKNGVNWESEVYVKNNLGSTVAVHNITRDAQAYRTDYEPYGKLKLEVLTSDVGVTNQFTGKEFEARIGLYYYGARYYDPELGIWIGPDAAGQHHSSYTYGSNNPMNRVDPDGNYDAWVHWLGAYFGSLFGGESFSDSWSIANHSVAIDFSKGSQADNKNANTVHAMQMTGEGLSDNEVYSRSNDLSLKILSGEKTNNPVVDDYLSAHGNTRNARLGVAIHINQDMDAHHGAPMDEHLSFRHPFRSTYRILNDANPLHIPLAGATANQVIKTEGDLK